MDSGLVHVKRGTIYYETQGQGRPLVLIHAGFLDRRMWDPQFIQFSKKYRVIRYDVRGFGKSSKAEDKYSDIEDLHSLLQHLKIDKAHIIGVSNGGRIAIDFTTNNPDMVDRLVLVGSGCSGYQNSPEEDKVWKEFEQHMASQEELVKQGKLAEAAMMDVEAWASAQDPESRKKIITMALDNSQVAAHNPWKFQVHPDPPGYQRLTEIRAPTFVMVGDRDVKGMRLIAETIHKKVPGSKYKVVKGADHIVNMSRTDEFNREVLDFLGKISHVSGDQSALEVVSGLSWTARLSSQGFLVLRGLPYNQGSYSDKHSIPYDHISSSTVSERYGRVEEAEPDYERK